LVAGLSKTSLKRPDWPQRSLLGDDSATHRDNAIATALCGKQGHCSIFQNC
jgi:hypothetical protein